MAAAYLLPPAAMIYKFKSKATGDLIMLGPHGDQVLRLMGREPAATGIIEPAALAAALAALQDAVAAEAARAAEGDDTDTDQPRAVALRQRAWPMVEMLRRAQTADAAVVWGV
jgi:hypothetical protein